MTDPHRQLIDKWLFSLKTDDNRSTTDKESAYIWYFSYVGSYYNLEITSILLQIKKKKKSWNFRETMNEEANVPAEAKDSFAQY